MDEDSTLRGLGAGNPEARAGALALGTILAETYQIGALIGRGGMAEVYEARDLALGRTVAIKIASDTWASEPLRMEGRALAAIRHPAVVAIHASATTGPADSGGRAFLVLERLLGHSLQVHIDGRVGGGGRFGVPEAVEVIAAIADGLRVIHDAGLSHRDLKPSNVVVTPPGRYVLIDFGLVVPEFEVGVIAKPLAGTLNAMAPEVILEDVQRGSGPLVDLYALGCIGFELLTGRPPFAGSTVGEILSQHLHGDIPDVRTVRPDVPAHLATLVTRLLSKDPCDRIQTAEAVAFSLRRGATLDSPGPIAVLIVDDDREAWERLAASIRCVAPEASIEAVPDAETAIARVAVRVPDVVLVDLVLPVMSGVELVMWLRGEPRLAAARVLVSSAAATEADRSLLRQLGVTRFVDKTSDLDAQLAPAIAEIRDLLRASSMRGRKTDAP